MDAAPLAGKPATDAQFITAFTAALRSAGMAPEALKSVTNHSFRAGGATETPSEYS